MIGVAIPCYSGHAHLLNSLLENIYNSTVKPSQIALSCSSWDKDELVTGNYKDIPIKVKYSKRQINQAENRNIAASLLDTELISFIDSDDLMHPQRLEYIIEAFKQSSFDVIYHTYEIKHDDEYNDPFEPLNSVNLLNIPFVTDANKSLGLLIAGNSVPLHNSHLTIKKKIMKRFKFDENWEVYRSEDSLFSRMLVENKVPCGYIDNKLSRYMGWTPKN
jgi:glycosyltransferase involved in cell wall biosynthesis